MARSDGEIPRRPLGRTGATVSALGLGGYHLALAGSRAEAVRIVHAAIDAGLDFLDNAWEYHEGRSEEWMGAALAGGWRDRAFLMTKVCSHGRSKGVALRQLEESLRRLRTDHVDLWQVHEVVYHDDPDRHFAKGGVIEALDTARAQGKVRFVGFTGHKDPEIHRRMLAYGYPFDTCQMPLNVFDGGFRSFEQQVLPEVLRLGIAPIGMKPMGGSGAAVKKRVLTAEESLRYAMSLPVAVTITGIDSMRVLRQDLRIARGFRPFTDAQRSALRRKASAFTSDGRFELYKTTAHHEGVEGRKQHGYPSEKELAG